MNENFSEELKKELVKQAVKSLDDPFKMLTVKDVAKDLYMGENKTNEIFNRADFHSVNIGKTRKIQKIAYILWKMEKVKRYYWIKLKTDFFNSDEIDFLLSQKDGCQYIVLYQMLCLQTANNNGELVSRVGEMIVPYKPEKIARDTKYFSIDTVIVALELFKKLHNLYR